MSRTSKITYNPKLSVKVNAKINGVSEAGIRYYIKVNKVDRRFERKENVIADCKRYLKKHPNASRNTILKGTGHSLTTIRKYWKYIVEGEELTGFDRNKETQRKQKTKDTSLKDLLNLINECKAAEQKNTQWIEKHNSHLPCPSVSDLKRWEEYDASKYLCYAFKKRTDLRKGQYIPFGNMNGGFPFSLCGYECLTSESAYIIGLFSDNTPEHIALQEELLKENNGRKAKKDIRHANEDIARKDWYDFNVQWMLYVVWQKIQGNEEFRNLLMAVPEGATIIEDTSFQHGSKENDTTIFWGAKNNERKDFDALVKRYIKIEQENAKKGTKKRLKAEVVNQFTDYGTYRGCNVMGKILTICRKCLADGTEPEIDYDLLKSKHIHFLGKEIVY